MPELPEIETVKIQLEKVLVGQAIVQIEKLHLKSLHGDQQKIIEKKVIGIRRFGKMLVIDVEGSLSLAIHFKMSGQLILIKRGKGKGESVKKDEINNRIVGGHPTEDWVNKLPSAHTRVVFYFESGYVLYFNDQRIFGWVKILTQKELDELPFIQKLGKEIWKLSDKEFYELFHNKKRAIKVLLMDQALLSGVGNIYANDALWEAKIHPKTRASDLTQGQAKSLRVGLIKVLDEGIKYGGATAADAKYMNLHGMGGTYQNHFRTYDQNGKPCKRCKTIIEKVVLGGRGTYFCPKCQKI